MAGLYVHIPFCRKLCYYCDFHFTVSLKWKDRLFGDLLREIRSRANEGKDMEFDTLYFGGGTPSVLSPGQVQELIDTLREHYIVKGGAEISFEANPDDLSGEYLRSLKETTAVNRLSIGIQAFQDKHLDFLNRRHTAKESLQCIERTLARGYENLNVDLIYGIPGMNQNEWQENLNTIDYYHIPHLSAYHLSFEPKTVLTNYLKKGKIHAVDEEISVAQYNLLTDFAESKGYDNYEISNFALESRYSRHNLGYWTGKYYLGFGPSAHSYNGTYRRWNLANNSLYMQEIESGSDKYFDEEFIDKRKAFNEYLLTALRTKWGIDMEYIEEKFGPSKKKNCLEKIDRFRNEELFIESGTRYSLNRKGRFISDYIISELMV